MKKLNTDLKITICINGHLITHYNHLLTNKILISLKDFESWHAEHCPDQLSVTLSHSDQEYIFIFYKESLQSTRITIAIVANSTVYLAKLAEQATCKHHTVIFLKHKNKFVVGIAHQKILSHVMLAPLLVITGLAKH